jgi:hypothetical protein
MGRHGLDCSGLGLGQLGACECDSELSGSIKWRETLFHDASYGVIPSEDIPVHLYSLPECLTAKVTYTVLSRNY